MAHQSGIYKITCMPTGKFYIGSTVSFKNRWHGHRDTARKGVHHNRHIQSAWNKYGEHTFKFEVLLLCTKTDLILYEQLAIDSLEPRFNAKKLACSMLGFKHSAVSKANMSAAQKGRTISTEARIKISAALKDRTEYAEVCEKLAGFSKNLKHSESTKAQISSSMKSRPDYEANAARLRTLATGRQHSDETKAKMRAARRAYFARLNTQQT